MGTEVSRVHCKTEEPTLSNEQRGHPPPYPINTPATGSLGLFVLQCVRGCTVLAHPWLHDLCVSLALHLRRAVWGRVRFLRHIGRRPAPGPLQWLFPLRGALFLHLSPRLALPRLFNFCLNVAATERPSVSCHQSEVSPHLILWVSLTTAQTVLFYFISFFFFILTLAPPPHTLWRPSACSLSLWVWFCFVLFIHSFSLDSTYK